MSQNTLIGLHVDSDPDLTEDERRQSFVFRPSSSVQSLGSKRAIVYTLTEEHRSIIAPHWRRSCWLSLVRCHSSALTTDKYIRNLFILRRYSMPKQTTIEL